MSIEKEHAEAWRRYIVDAGASEEVAQQAVTLAAFNGLFDLHRIASLPWHPATQEWRDINSAPKDGMYLIANALGEVCPAQVRDGERTVQNMVGFADWTFGQHATLWRPLPMVERRLLRSKQRKTRNEESEDCR